MSSPPNVEEMQREIQRLTQTVETLKKDAPVIRQRKCSDRSPSPRRYPAHPALQAFDLHEAKTVPRPSKRKEIEARRFNGKESVVDYLRQFELTAKRNQ